MKIRVVGYGYWGPNLVRNFSECVRSSKSPLSSAAAGLSDVRLLEAAQKSIANGGARVAV